MILAAGLTPAWQQILCFSRLQRGDVNRATQAHWCASGKVINAGMALATLGASAHVVSPVGGWSGQALANDCARRGLSATWTPSQSPTRVCTTLLDDTQHDSTELVENAGPLTPDERAEFLTPYRRYAGQAEAVVLTGSLPAQTPATFYRELLEATPCPAVLDARGPELLAALPCRPRVIKPNRDELALTVNRPLPDRASVLTAMRTLIERGARSVIVTQGKAAVWVMESETSGLHAWELIPPEVKVAVNPIGCGDCLAAALAWSLARGDTLLDAVRMGMAAAADNVTQFLPSCLSLSRVEAWVRQIPPPRPLDIP